METKPSMTLTTQVKNYWALPLFRGFFTFSAMRYSTKFLVLLRLILVARFLGPRELGLFGLATMVVSVAEVFTETGINLVLLKNPEKLKSYIHTAWAVSIIRGIVIAVCIWLSSGLLGKFYEDSSLSSYLLLAGLIPLLRGFINPAIITYQQELNFGRESLLRTSLQLIDVLSGFAFVLLMNSSLGLVLGVVLSATIELVLSFALFRQWPTLLRAKFSQVKSLYAETKVIIGHGILNYFTEHADDFLIGKLLGTTGLGIYQTAYKWASAASIDIGYILGQTVYPIYARNLDNPREILSIWKKSSILLLGLLVGAGCIILPFTDTFVRVLLGEEWLASIPAIRLLFMAGAIKACITAWNPLALLADKLQHFILVNALIVMIMLPAIWWFAPRFGASGASWGVLLALILVFPHTLWITYSSLRKLAFGKR
jgi:O-antigen/teichoic acid export membrane protein